MVDAKCTKPTVLHPIAAHAMEKADRFQGQLVHEWAKNQSLKVFQGIPPGWSSGISVVVNQSNMPDLRGLFRRQGLEILDETLGTTGAMHEEGRFGMCGAVLSVNQKGGRRGEIFPHGDAKGTTVCVDDVSDVPAALRVVVREKIIPPIGDGC